MPPQEWKQQLQAAGQSIVGMPVMPDPKETSGDAG